MKPLAQERSPAAESRDTRAHRIEAVVVSGDDGLLIELGPILGNRYRTHAVDTPAQIAAVVHAPRWLGIVDVATLADARGAVARMELQFHRCPLIIVCPNPEEWAGAVARGAAAAALARHELAGPRLTDALAAAEARLRSEPMIAEAAASDVGNAERSGAGPLARKAGWIALAAALLGMLAAGAWWLSRGPHAAGATAAAARNDAGMIAGAAHATAAPTAVPAPPPPQPQSVLELLSAARVAFGDQKLLLPRADGQARGDSALELYTQALRQQPDNAEALDGIRRLFAIGRARIQNDLVSGRLDDATRLVGLFQAAGISGGELQPLMASISTARPKWIATRAQQAIAAGNLAAAQPLIAQLAASGASPASITELQHSLDARKLDVQLTGLANRVKAAIAAGALLEPASDNARTRLATLRMASRGSPQTLAATRALQAALLARAQQATHAGQFEPAQRDISAAADLGGASNALAAAKQQLHSAIDSARRRAAAAAAAQAHAASVAHAAAAAPSDPAHAAAAAARPKPAPAPYVAARPVRALDVSYPEGSTGVAGRVIVEFTLEPDGSASDPKIIQSVPRGVFDQVALKAISGGRYDTHDLAGRTPPVRARILLRFKPN